GDVAAPVPNARGMVMPIAGPVGYADTWGSPRSGGRRHQGTDVMAACGARVVAVADGSVSPHQSGNGGRMLYLHAANGDTYLYSHLQGYAYGIGSGARVKAGQVIGYNGNTGNARGGPCHVHFEWHPKGGRPVNPYPLLRSI
ncbi:MAG: murein hydrolase activator EnvC family protein, partial [Actinomycetota bacterium]